jgi:hypothetical protein
MPPEQEWTQLSAEESSPLEGTGRYDPERSMRTKLIIIGVALLCIMGAYAYLGTRDRSLDVETDALIFQQQEDGLICCTVPYQHNAQSYLLLVTRELEGEFRRVAFRVMELDETGAPREINAIGSPIDGLLPTRFAVVDQTVYVPLNGPDDAGVWAIDLSDPAWPETLGFIPTGDGIARQLAAAGDRLAINHTDEIAVLDISTPADPSVVSRIEQAESGFINLKVVDARLFVNDAVHDELRVFDLSTADNPTEMITHRNPDGPGELEIEFGPDTAEDWLDQSVMPSKYLDFVVDDELIYLAASDLGVRVLDIADPDNPEIIVDVELPDRASRIAQSGDRLYVLGASEGNVQQLTYAIHTLDMSDRSEPVHVDTINGILAEPGIQAFSAHDNRLFVGLYESLLVFDVGE